MHKTHYRLTFTVIAVGVTAYSLLQSMTVPAIPTIQRELGTDQATAAWVLTAFLFSAAVATPIGGRLGDAVGKKHVFVASLSLLAAGCMLSIVAPTIQVMIAARVIQGLGGGVIPLAFGIARDELPSPRVPGAVAFLSSLLAVGFAAGVVLAGPIIDVFGYGWLFALPVLVSTTTAIVAHFVLPAHPVSGHPHVPWLSAIVMAAWLGSLLLGLAKAPSWGGARRRPSPHLPSP